MDESSFLTAEQKQRVLDKYMSAMRRAGHATKAKAREPSEGEAKAAKVAAKKKAAKKRAAAKSARKARRHA